MNSAINFLQPVYLSPCSGDYRRVCVRLVRHIKPRTMAVLKVRMVWQLYTLPFPHSSSIGQTDRNVISILCVTLTRAINMSVFKAIDVTAKLHWKRQKCPTSKLELGQSIVVKVTSQIKYPNLSAKKQRLQRDFAIGRGRTVVDLRGGE